MPPEKTEARLPSWRYPDRPTAGRFEGAEHASEVSFHVIDMTDGQGPDLHTHPYSETFVLLEGRGRFALGEEWIEAEAGQVVVAPAGTPHGFKAMGQERLKAITIHAAPAMDTTWV